MTQSVSRLSDKWVWITLGGFVSLLAIGFGYDFIPNAKQYGYEISGSALACLGLFIVSQIQIRRLDKKQCKLGQHNPDDLMVCRDCHKHLEGSEDLIDQHSRDLDKQLSKKSGMLKFLAIPVFSVIFMLGFGYWIVTSSHAYFITEINSMNATDPQSCLYLVKQQALEQGVNAWMIGSHVVKATNQKWTELDCIHKPIMDDLNQTCAIGVIPKLDGLNGFLCYPGEKVANK